MQKPNSSMFSRRERQIMDVLYKLERATVAEVLSKLPGKPHYSTVRAQLRALQKKGHVRHEERGLRKRRTRQYVIQVSEYATQSNRALATQPDDPTDLACGSVFRMT